MGEIAEMILEGILCDVCGCYIGSSTGAPRTCGDCKPVKTKRLTNKQRKAEAREAERRKKNLERRSNTQNEK